MGKREIIKILRESKTEARERYKARLKGVFGSFVHNRQTRKSDVDVLVDFDKGASLLDLAGLSIFLEEKIRRPVDIVPKSAIRKELKSVILKETFYL
ncbi:MAG: nucleotidyltransferase domain-containing protein [Planctomycetes bacterium]|nr:nucleotidyltransferase domain-containing protein [Planctomycetota bacterium]